MTRRRRHGTLSTYVGINRPGCRCAPCREAKRRHEANRAIPSARAHRYTIERDVAAMCEDRVDPRDMRRLDRVIVHLGARGTMLALRSHAIGELIAVAR